jgi:RNA polymerase sigma factor (sigma-70 family)
MGYLTRHADPDDAEEACAATWEKAARRPELLPPDDQRAGAYLAVVARNEARRLRRQRAHRHEQLGRAGLRVLELDRRATLGPNAIKIGEVGDTFTPAPGPSVEDQAAARAEVASVAAVARALTPAQRRPWGRFLAGDTYRQVAAAEDMSYTAVNRHLTEGRRKFRAALA